MLRKRYAKHFVLTHRLSSMIHKEYINSVPISIRIKFTRSYTPIKVHLDILISYL